MEVKRRRGRPLELNWQESSKDLYERYRRERNPELRIRYHALWLVSQGRTEREAARIVGVDERTVGRWISWYRQSGIGEIARRRRGGRQGRRSRLSPEQLAALKAKVAEGEFRTIGEAVEWVKQNFRQHYTYWGMRSLFQRLHFKKKVPRPLGQKASLEAQDAWKKGAWVPSLRESA